MRLQSPPSYLITLMLMIPFVLHLGLALDLYLPSIPSMTQALNASPAQIQLTLSLFMYCFGSGQLLIGPASDLLGRRKLILLSLSIFTMGSILCASVSSLTPLLIGRVLQAWGACGTMVISLAMIRDQFDGKNATRLFTSLKAAMALAPIVAPILGAFLQIYYGWHATFIALALYGIMTLLLAFFCLPETRVRTFDNAIFSKTLTTYWWLLKNPTFVYYCGCNVAAQAAMFGYFSLSPRYFITHFGLNESQFAVLFSVNAVTFLLTGLFAGKLIYLLGFKKSTLLAAVLLLISGASMGYAHYFYDHYFNLFIPNLVASASAAIMLGAATSGALMPFKQQAGAAAALLGCLEFIVGAKIGSIAIIGTTATILPLALILILLGGGILLLALQKNILVRS